MGNDKDTGLAISLYLTRVVGTPPRAGPSVAGGINEGVELFGHFRIKFGRRSRRPARLLEPEDGDSGQPFFQFFFNGVEKVTGTDLAIVNQTDFFPVDIL